MGTGFDSRERHDRPRRPTVRWAAVGSLGTRGPETRGATRGNGGPQRWTQGHWTQGHWTQWTVVALLALGPGQWTGLERLRRQVFGPRDAQREPRVRGGRRP
jgi:hypothetical protein